MNTIARFLGIMSLAITFVSAILPMTQSRLVESEAMCDLTRIANMQRQRDRQRLRTIMDKPKVCFSADSHRDPVATREKAKYDLNELMSAMDPLAGGTRKTETQLANLLEPIKRDVNDLGICNAQCVVDPVQSLVSKYKNVIANISLLNEILFFTDDEPYLMDVADQSARLIRQGIRCKKIIRKQIAFEDTIKDRLNTLMSNSRFINATKEQRLAMAGGGSLGILRARKFFGPKKH